jgi:hypothetical protein
MDACVCARAPGYVRRTLTSLQLAEVILHVIWGDAANKIDIIIAVEASKLRVVNKWRPLQRRQNDTVGYEMWDDVGLLLRAHSQKCPFPYTSHN